MKGKIMEIMEKFIPKVMTPAECAAQLPAECASEIPAEKTAEDLSESRTEPIKTQAAPAADTSAELEALRRETAELRAALANAENRLSAPPSPPKGGDGGFFSPDEVRRMSRTEVRENMKTIRESMRRWK